MAAFENARKFNIGTAIFNIGDTGSRHGSVLVTPSNSLRASASTRSTSFTAGQSAAERPSFSLNDNSTDNERQTDGMDAPNNPNQIVQGKPLDIVFIQDSTGSQGPYIKSARLAISDICAKLSSSPFLSDGALRFGLIAFRDHPPEDVTFVTKNFGFTRDPETMRSNLAGLRATGGGDGPEAVTAALADALNIEWNEEAVKIVILITDAPPHGLGEHGDGFPDGSPDQNDPIDIARQMAECGIALFVVACEPTLSSRYRNAVDFYRGICDITSGMMLPLVNASQLGDYIVGSAVETMETEALVNEYQSEILEGVYGQGKPLDEVMQKVEEQMASKATMVNTFNLPPMYAPNDSAGASAQVWSGSANLSAARSACKPSGATLISTYTEAARAEACKEEALTPPSFPDVKMKKTVVGRRLSARVGDLILSRNAKVEANGVLRPTGKYEGCAPVTRSFGHTDEATPSQTMPSIVIQGEGGEQETLAPVKSPSADGSSADGLGQGTSPKGEGGQDKSLAAVAEAEDESESWGVHQVARKMSLSVRKSWFAVRSYSFYGRSMAPSGGDLAAIDEQKGKRSQEPSEALVPSG